MKAFISYSTREKSHGGRIKAIFDELGIESFLAHEDLNVSEEWERRILSEVKSCQIFVPLLSSMFKESDWCSQETGIIVNRRGVLVIPLSIDGVMPYGFISHIQGHSLTGDDVDKEVILNAIGKKWPTKIIDLLMPTMERVFSFREAESVMNPFRPYFAYFSPEQANRFARLSVANGQIWSAHLCRREYMPEFLAHNEDKIESNTLAALKYQIDNQSWYRDENA